MQVNNFQSTNFTERDLSYCFDIMENTIKAGQGRELDLGFIEIFAADIEQLTDKPIQSQLSSKLQRLSNKIYEAVEAPLFPTQPNDLIRPLVGTVKSLASLAKEYSPGPIKTGLAGLDPYFAMKAVAGDGHCFFRSVAERTLDFLGRLTVQEQQRFFERIDQQVRLFNHRELDEKYRQALALIKEISAQKRTIDEVISQRPTSDILVWFLRELACSHNEVYGDEVFASEAIESDGSVAQYLQNMRDMKQAKMAGQTEILALEQTLGISIEIVSPTSTRKVVEAGERPTFFLLYRPGHYDIAIPKR